MVAGGGASVIYADTVWFSIFGCRISMGSETLLFSTLLFPPFPLASYIQLIVAYQVGDLGYASELGNYAEYSGAPNEEEVLHYARVVIDVRTLSLHSLVSCYHSH